MSYRLINANAMVNYKGVNDMPCIYVDLPNGLDGGYYNLTRGNTDKSRYSELFGTPERAAQTLTHVCQFTHGGEMCDRCQCYLFDKCNRELRLMSEQRIYDALLEWLSEEEDE